MILKPKILLLTSELFPRFGYPTAGGGVRAQQLYDSLTSSGFQVELGILKSSVEGKKLPDWAGKYLYHPSWLDGLIEQADPDMVISESWEPLSHLRFSDQRVYVADCPGPLILESLLGGQEDLRSSVFHKVRTLSRVDAILCPNRPMRHYLTSYLTLAGWPPDQPERIHSLPIALSQDLPARKPAADSQLCLFFGGISWAWHQSTAWLLSLADQIHSMNWGKIIVRTGPHPHHHLDESLYEPIPEQVRDHPSIHLKPLTGWNSLVEDLCSIPLAIEWSPRHLERELASTLRLVTYLWCGVPVIIRPHLDLAGKVADYQAGWIIDEWEDLLALLKDIQQNPGILRTRSENALKLARDRHQSALYQDSLADFLATLKKRDPSPSFLDHASSTFRFQEEVIHAQEQRILNLDHQNQSLEEALKNRDSLILQRDQDLAAVHNLVKTKDLEIMGRDQSAQGLHENLQACLAEIQNLQQQIRQEHTDAESYRAIRQKFIYKMWKRLSGWMK